VLDADTKKKIDSLRNILVGKIPNPQSQVEQITTGLIYKFMHDMDQESIDMGGEGSFFVGDYEKYSWSNLFDTKLSGVDKVKLYSDAIEGMYLNPSAPELFRNIFKNAFLPFKDPSTLNMFLKEINEFHYSHSEKLGDAFEYLISIMGSQGDAGQFRTPRHIIDFIVEIINPQKHETVLDPACGTGGFLISSYKHILKTNTDKKEGDLLSASDRKKVGKNIGGYDISPEMIKLSLVNMYLHGFSTPNIEEYDTLSSEDNWNEYYDVILANPPFFSPSGGIQPHKRFGVESKKAEVLFTSYILEHLKPNGRAGIIIPEGIIFQTGKAYKELRKQLIENALIGVISLPAGVFNPYAGVKTSVLILDKKESKDRRSIFFADVKNDGFNLGAQRTLIKENDLPKLLSSIKSLDKKLIYITKQEILNDSEFSLSRSKYNKVVYENSIFEMVELREVCIKITDGSHNPPKANKGAGYHMLSSRNIFNNELVLDETREIDKEGFDKEDKRTNVNDGDILLTCVGTIGRSLVVRNPPYRFTLQRSVCVLKPNKEYLNSEYLSYVLQSKICQEILIDNAHGVAQKGIYLKTIREIKIPLPPLEVQQEIVDKLEGYQKIIDGCKQVVENYKPTIDIDPSWKRYDFGELIDENVITHRNGSAISEILDDGIPYIKVSDMNLTQNIPEITTSHNFVDIDFPKEKIVKTGAIIFPKVGQAINTDKKRITKVDCFVDGNTAIVEIINKEILNEYFFYYSFASIPLNSLCHDPGGYPSINKNGFRQGGIHIPSIDLQKEIVQKIEQERKVIEGNKKLIEIYSQKIQNRINKVWGED
tara:strand:+ start:3665 stop:6127 length:2463 start_codon:yes stop_codon:yes gene_type:complete